MQDDEGRGREHRAPRSPDAGEFLRAVKENLYYGRGAAVQSASRRDIYWALACTVRDQLIKRWSNTTAAQYENNPKFVYYLSAEYLLGKQLAQNLLYTGLTEVAAEALALADLDLQDFLEMDREPGLGNGGLGRLAACYMDSLATLELPAAGYGIRYEYGIFEQTFVDGWQVERPDEWLLHANPWEFAMPDDMVQVHFYGSTEYIYQSDGSFHVKWTPGLTVRGEPYHTLVPGYGVETVNILRLWRARASEEFNFHLFDTGDYAEAVAQKVLSENITKVLYPNDNAPQGRELRLKQQYFFVACSLHDILRRFHLRNEDVTRFHEQVVVQLNDTHPVIAIPELMRLLLDYYHLGWDKAWEITSHTFAYTCHTLLPEALEKWPVTLLEYLLPRHLEVIYEINRRFIDQVRGRFPGDEELVKRISIIDGEGGRSVRMAHLACVGSFAVNGVAELHTKLLTEETLRDFAAMWPDKFRSITNGVTPRRFMKLANPRLSRLITSVIGDGWVNDLEQLRRLEEHVEDVSFRQSWREVKQQNKQDLALYLSRAIGVEIDAGAIFDVLVKRLHEYKRQLLKVLHIIALYQRIKGHPAAPEPPRLFLFGAKAAPGYHRAKLIIKLINSVAEVVNGDPDVAGRLVVGFPANFNVSMAERIYPAADISEQISLAGMEASGTGNMKFALNGALTVGTLDGANIEIRERVGAENFFHFGLTAEEVAEMRRKGYSPQPYYDRDPELRAVIESIAGGEFSFGNKELFRPIVDELLFRDPFMLFADFADYVACQDRAAAAYLDSDNWTRMSILNCARCGYFSSDRSVKEYAQDVWSVEPLSVVPTAGS